MKKINSDKISLAVHKDNFIYVFELKGKYINLKRIETNKSIDIINISHDNVDFNRIYYFDKKRKYYKFSDIEKDILVNDIIKNIDVNFIKEVIDLNYILNVVKKSYIKTIVSNEEIGLSVNNDQISIVLLSTNSIIGEIKRDYDVRVRVDKKYLKDSLKLLSEYVSLNNKNVNQKILVKN